MRFPINWESLCIFDHYWIGKPLSSPLLCDQVNHWQGVFEVDFATGLTLIEIADGVTVDEIKSKTEAPFKVAKDLKPML